MQALHFIKAGDEVNNFDLFVIAQSAEDAIALWRHEFGTDRDELPDRIWQLSAMSRGGATAVPLESRALPWNDPDGAALVWPVDDGRAAS